MSHERAAMRGKLAEAKARSTALEGAIERYSSEIRAKLNTALTPVAELDVAGVQSAMADLADAWAEYTALRGRMARLTRELEVL